MIAGMYTLLSFALIFVVWVGSTIAIIKVDAARQRKAAAARGDVDFIDRSVTPYLALAFIAGALPLIFYFGTSRKKASGWLLGLGLFALDLAFVGVIGAALTAGAHALDHQSVHRQNLVTDEGVRVA